MDQFAAPPAGLEYTVGVDHDFQGLYLGDGYDHTDQNDQPEGGQAEMNNHTHPHPLSDPPPAVFVSASASAGPGPLQLTSEDPYPDVQMQAETQARSGPRPLSSVRRLAAANGGQNQGRSETAEGVVDAQSLQGEVEQDVGAVMTTRSTTQPTQPQPSHGSQNSQRDSDAAGQLSAVTANTANTYMARNDTLVSRPRKTRAASRVRPSRSPRSRPPRSTTPSCASCASCASFASSRCSSVSRSPSTSKSRSRPRYCLPSSPAERVQPPLHDPDTPINNLPNEIILHVLGFLDVNDLLATSRTCHHLRCLCIAPILHIHRMRYIRAALPPLLTAPQRPSLADLIQRSIFLTNTTVVSRKLARSLVAIRLSHRLAARPPVHVLVERCVLPPECAPGIGHVAPALAARTRAIEREKLKDGLRSWIGAVWKREVGRRSERMRRNDESVGVGKVWRLRKFWERVSRSPT